MKRRNKDVIYPPKRRVEDKPEIFTMTQEEFADPVTWDDSDQPQFESVAHQMSYNDGEIFDTEYGNDEEGGNGSSMWRELEKKNKRKRATTPNELLLPPTLQSLVPQVSVPPDTSEQLGIQVDTIEPPFENGSAICEKHIGTECCNSSISIPASTSSQSFFVDATTPQTLNLDYFTHQVASAPTSSFGNDFELSEDDFQRMENEALLKQQQNPVSERFSQSTVLVQSEVVEGDIDSQAYLDLLDEIERHHAQAAASSHTGTTSSQKHDVAVSMINRQSPDVQNASLLLRELACIRLVAIVVEDHRSIHRKLVHANMSQVDERFSRSGLISSLGQTKITVELCDEWYDSIIEKGDIFHVINVGSQLLASSLYNQQDCHGMLNCIIKLHTPTETRIVISSEFGLIAICPDVFISPTKVAESCTCTRRGVLSDRIRSFGMSASSAVMGNVRHTFIEDLTERVLTVVNEVGVQEFSEKHIMSRLPPPVINKIIQSAIEEHVQDLYCIHKSDDEVTRDLYAAIAPTMSWVTMAASLGTKALTLNHPAHQNISADLLQHSHGYQICEIVGVEESIHSPLLGIKGQIDMIAGGTVATISHEQLSTTALSNLITLPIEFKTGKWRPMTSVAHRAQVILYILLMMMRRSIMRSIEGDNVDHTVGVSQYGLILYINDKEMKVDFIKPEWHEIKSLIISRNNLAKSIYSSTHSNNNRVSDSNVNDIENGVISAPKQTSTIIYDNNFSWSNEKNGTITRLPPLLKSLHECSYCYSAAECFMYHASIENGNEVSSGVPLLYNYILTGISHKHISYLKHWDHLIDLESVVNEDSIQGLWSMSGPEREKLGAKCMSRLTLTSVKSGINLMETEDDSVREIPVSKSASNNKFVKNVLISFSRLGTSTSINDSSFSDAVFMVGDRVFVSMEQCHDECGVSLNQQKDCFNEVMNEINANICSGSIYSITRASVEVLVTQGYRSILKFQKYDQQAIIKAGWFYRLDKDDSNINISTMRSNLMELFVESFNPGMFIQANKVIPPTALTRTNSQSNQQLDGLLVNQALQEKSMKGAYIRQRIRELIVDLREPKFRSIPGPLNFAVQPNRPVTKNLALVTSLLSSLKANLVEMDYEIMYHLFCPLGMDKKVFQVAIKGLMIMTTFGSADDGPLYVQPGCPANHVIGSGNANNSLLSLLRDVNILKSDDGRFIITPSEINVYPGCHPLQLYREYLLLNPGQREALHKVLFCEDYVLLWGLPGTGKTYTLGLIVRIIVSRQETVLLTSYTHNAVDHIMNKLVDKGMTSKHVVRIQGSSTISTNPPESTGDMGSIAAFQKQISSIRVFVATILTVSRNVLFKSQHIHCSYCVIDEAGQITTPVILAGLLHAHKFILSGDDHQLPPLIVSQEAAKKGMAISLLKQLMSIHNHAVSTLYIQYRMNESIMSLCNRLIYEERMLCGNNEVATRRLSIPFLDLIPMPFGGSPPVNLYDRKDWLFQALSPENSVIMLNTDGLPVLEKSSSEKNLVSSLSVESLSDALIVKALLVTLLDYCQLSTGSEVAIITPFRAQVSLLQQLLQSQSPTPNTSHQSSVNENNLTLLKRYALHHRNYDVSTVDKYQGKDRDVVIFNTVKKIKSVPSTASNSDTLHGNVDSVGTLLRDWRRINVALTRAKQKLIIIGSKSMMQQEPMLKALVDFMIERNWMIDLLPNSLQAYRFESSPKIEIEQQQTWDNPTTTPSLDEVRAGSKRNADDMSTTAETQSMVQCCSSIEPSLMNIGGSHGKRIRVEYDLSNHDYPRSSRLHTGSVLSESPCVVPKQDPVQCNSFASSVHTTHSNIALSSAVPVFGRKSVDNDGKLKIGTDLQTQQLNFVGNIHVPMASVPLNAQTMSIPPLYGSKMVAGTQLNPFSGPPKTIAVPVLQQTNKVMQRSATFPVDFHVTSQQAQSQTNTVPKLQNYNSTVSKPMVIHSAYGKRMQPGTTILLEQQQRAQQNGSKPS